MNYHGSPTDKIPALVSSDKNIRMICDMLCYICNHHSFILGMDLYGHWHMIKSVAPISNNVLSICFYSDNTTFVVPVQTFHPFMFTFMKNGVGECHIFNNMCRVPYVRIEVNISGISYEVKKLEPLSMFRIYAEIGRNNVLSAVEIDTRYPLTIHID